MPALLSKPASFYLSAVVIISGFVFSMAINIPGHLSYDSVIQLLEGRTGTYGGWHPAIMSWLLGLADAVVPGTALFVLLSALLPFAAMLSLLWLPTRVSYLAVLTGAMCVCSPQLFLYQGIVWKDVQFANAAVAGFVTLAHLESHWPSTARRYGIVLLSLLFFVVAALTRQNGSIVLPIACVGVGALAYRATGKAFIAARYGLWALISATFLVACGDIVLTAGETESGVARQLERLQAYDLAGAMAHWPALKLDQVAQGDPALAAALENDGGKLYSPQRSDTLARSKALNTALADSPDRALQAQWLNLILQHTGLYLADRAEVFRWVFLTPDINVCVPYVVGVDGPSRQMTELGLASRYDARDEALDNYGQFWIGTPLFSHVTFAILAIVEWVFLFYRRRSPDIAVASMLTAAMLFTLTFFIVSIACDYRYLYFLDLAAVVGLFHIAVDPKVAPRRDVE